MQNAVASCGCRVLLRVLLQGALQGAAAQSCGLCLAALPSTVRKFTQTLKDGALSPPKLLQVVDAGFVILFLPSGSLTSAGSWFAGRLAQPRSAEVQKLAGGLCHPSSRRHLHFDGWKRQELAFRVHRRPSPMLKPLGCFSCAKPFFKPLVLPSKLDYLLNLLHGLEF